MGRGRICVPELTRMASTSLASPAASRLRCLASPWILTNSPSVMEANYDERGVNVRWCVAVRIEFLQEICVVGGGGEAGGPLSRSFNDHRFPCRVFLESVQ